MSPLAPVLAPAPAAVVPEATWPASYGLDDMTVLLAACATEPQRLRASGLRLFARIQETLGGLLSPLSQEALRAVDASPEQRLDRAADRLRSFRLAKIAQEDDPGKPHLAATREGKKWLALPARQRLRYLLDALRQTARQAATRGAFPFLPDSIHLPKHAKFHGGEQVEQAFRDLPVGVFVDIDLFLRHHAETRNPLHELHRGKKPPDWLPALAEHREALWRHRLLGFLYERLACFGGAHLGYGGGPLSFALTDAGLYLLGAARSFSWTEETPAEVVVQPNFEVVFLAPSTLTEAALARFAERRGTGVGTLFRITRRSAVAAAAGGLTAEEALATLRRVAAKGVPDNVAREIAGWFSQCRSITMGPALLIDCPDAETTARVLAAGGKSVERLTDTVVRVRTPAKRAEILRKLKEVGVFLRKR